MKILYYIISVILLLFIIMITYISRNTNVEFAGTLPNLNIVIYSSLITIGAFLSGFIFNQTRIENIKNISLKQIRKAEKADINTKESLDKIERLNAKIETLEVALQEALKNKKS